MSGQNRLMRIALVLGIVLGIHTVVFDMEADAAGCGALSGCLLICATLLYVHRRGDGNSEDT